MTGWNTLLDTWTVLIGVLSACSCALVGNYLVLRKLSLMGDAISHAVLPGLAVAFIVTNSRAAGPMFLGAVIVGVLTGVLTEVIRRYGKVEHGAAMGVVFSLFFAAGLILIRRVTDRVDLDPGCVLYGNINQIALEALDQQIPQAAVILGGVLLANLLFVGLLYKELKICAFDPELASTLGIPAGLLHYGLMIMVAVTAVANFEVVGSILVIAMLIVPAAAAHLLTDRLGIMILLSVVLAAVSAVAGHILAAFGPGWLGHSGDANTAGMMAVVCGVLFAGALLLGPRHGIISRLVHRLQLSAKIVREDLLGLLYRWHERQSGPARGMTAEALLAAVGQDRLTRRALRALRRCGDVQMAVRDARSEFSLSPTGLVKAAQLVQSHRLWEAYLDKHFQLPSDHLHMPAERVEHYITPAIREGLREQLTDLSHDPHGSQIPE